MEYFEFKNNKMVVKKTCVLISMICIVLFGCKNEPVDNFFTVYAAAGTRNATNIMCDSFELKSNVRINRNFASSGILARQILHGGRADVYISANKEWVEYLLKEDLLVDTTVKILAKNKLVIVAPVHKTPDTIIFTPAFDIASTVNNKITIGDPAHVPVGKYAKAFLDSLGWFREVQNKIIMANDVSSVLRYVEMGECDWGIVYLTEAIQSNKVKIIAEIPSTLYPPVYFYMGRVKNSQKGAGQLQDFFIGKHGASVLHDHGFDTTKQEGWIHPENYY